jgi:tetratricopeptide (TPR) repeat protein
MKSKQFWEWFEGYVAPRVNGHPRLHRAGTFRQMFQHLDKAADPVCIIETGCIEDPENWAGNGCSTLIFDKYVALNGGRLYSVDIIPEKVKLAQSLVSENTTVTCADSVAYLGTLKVNPDLVYLDASHLYWHKVTPAQVHHYNEFMAILPQLRPSTLLVVDDSPAIVDEGMKFTIMGKGGLVSTYANEVGAEMVFSEYQTGWVGFPGITRNEFEDDDIELILSKGREQVEAGKWPQAYNCYRTVLMKLPPPWNGRQRVMYGEACAFFARLATQSERLGTAYDWYERALKADPRATDYRIELVNKSMALLGINEGAKEQAERCTKISPEDPMAWRTLALSYDRLGNLKQSLNAHNKQVQFSNRSSMALLDKVATLIDLEQYDVAESISDEVIMRNEPVYKADAFHCKAMIKARCDEHEEAIIYFERALSGGCLNGTLVHFHLALSLFSIGRYKEGFAHQSHGRLNRTDPNLFVPMQRFDRPMFAMQEPPALVHVHTESGAGDNFALWRFLPLLKQRGYAVRYEAGDDFFKLAKDSLTDIEVVPAALDYPGGVGLKGFDYHLPIGELPHVFGTNIDTVPWHGRYIKSDPTLAQKYKGAPKVGIAWSSGIREQLGPWVKRYGQLKSVSFELIRPIIETLPMLSFVSLQVGSPRAENDIIVDLLPEEPSWADTAALIENLDLVITPDTGLAHLAGAMGKPTWLMMHAHNQGWHFMCERPSASWNERSPWYPSMRIFRQKRGDDWTNVVGEIAMELRNGKIREAA